MIRTCKVKLGRAPKQESRISLALKLCCAVYNAALQQRVEAWKKQRISLSYYDQCKGLTELRADDEDYRRIPADLVRVTSLFRLEKSFRAFVAKKRLGIKVGFPRYKKDSNFKTLIFGKQHWKIDGRFLILSVDKVPMKFKMKGSLHRQGSIKGLQIVQHLDRLWAHFQVDIGPAPEVRNPCRGVGIDLGLKTFATLSDGNTIENPRFLLQSLEKLKDLQQVVSRKKVGSKNRGRARLKLARAYETVKNKRRNFVYQSVALLAGAYNGFALERLGMQPLISKSPRGSKDSKTPAFRRSIKDAAWSLFGACLENKAEEAGFPVVRVNPRGTSQRCSSCGTLVRKTLRTRIHECPACGLVLDRDENAARNILFLAEDLGWRSASGSLVRTVLNQKRGGPLAAPKRKMNTTTAETSNNCSQLDTVG